MASCGVGVGVGTLFSFSSFFFFSLSFFLSLSELGALGIPRDSRTNAMQIGKNRVRF